MCAQPGWAAPKRALTFTQAPGGSNTINAWNTELILCAHNQAGQLLKGRSHLHRHLVAATLSIQSSLTSGYRAKLKSSLDTPTSKTQTQYHPLPSRVWYIYPLQSLLLLVQRDHVAYISAATWSHDHLLANCQAGTYLDEED